MKKCILGSIFVLVLASTAIAIDIRKTGPKDKCPVCGMFVAKYPDFAAQIQFRDGLTFHFDGAKDLFKFYLNVPRYTPGREPADIVAVFVTNYYDLAMIDGLSAYYVVGSDVYGPMGRELIPFTRKSEARDFLKDHKGKSIIRLRDITPAVLRPLD
jgi:nitrous oxide reductase accessory protein NosL